MCAPIAAHSCCSSLLNRMEGWLTRTPRNSDVASDSGVSLVLCLRFPSQLGRRTSSAFQSAICGLFSANFRIPRCTVAEMAASWTDGRSANRRFCPKRSRIQSVPQVSPARSIALAAPARGPPPSNSEDSGAVLEKSCSNFHLFPMICDRGRLQMNRHASAQQTSKFRK